MKKNLKIFPLFVVLILLISCAKPTVVSSVLPGDNELNCDQLEDAIAESQKMRREAEYARTKGGKYMKRDDFRNYAANLRGKKTQYKQMKKDLFEIN